MRSGRRLAGFRRMAEVDRKGAERLAAELADAEVVAEVLPEAVETTAVVQAGAGAGAVQGVERAVASSPALVERAVSKFLNAWILPNNRCGREESAALVTYARYLNGKPRLWYACRDGSRIVLCSTTGAQNTVSRRDGQHCS